MARLHDIVIDCRHPASLARFWAAVLEEYAVAPYDDAELARLRSAGIDDPQDDPTVLVEGPPGAPRLWCQSVPEPKVTKNRMHLDLAVDDVGTEIERLLDLGAAVIADHRSEGGLVTLSDPEGNEFCLTG
ncbi:MAG: VOC family protein [Acidimicrobiales bacterium]